MMGKRLLMLQFSARSSVRSSLHASLRFSAGRVRRALHAVGAFLAVMLFATNAFASATEQLRQFGQSTSAARGEFSQVVAGRNGQAGRKSDGEFSFQRPGRFNWHIRKPFEQRIVADGSKLFIYDTDLAQVSIRPLGDALGATPAALLFGPQNLDTLFELRDEAAVQGIEWVSAIPRAKDSQFTRIRIGFSGKWPVQMELTDAMGQQTVLTLKNWKGADAVSADQFQFAIPAGVDVIDATQAAKRGGKTAQ